MNNAAKVVILFYGGPANGERAEVPWGIQTAGLVGLSRSQMTHAASGVVYEKFSQERDGETMRLAMRPMDSEVLA